VTWKRLLNRKRTFAQAVPFFQPSPNFETSFDSLVAHSGLPISLKSRLARGRGFWAGAAEAMVVLRFLNTCALTYKTYIAQSIEMLSIIVGDAGLLPYQIRGLPHLC
jgi:hypothetical protein